MDWRAEGEGAGVGERCNDNTSGNNERTKRNSFCANLVDEYGVMSAADRPLAVCCVTVVISETV